MSDTAKQQPVAAGSMIFIHASIHELIPSRAESAQLRASDADHPAGHRA